MLELKSASYLPYPPIKKYWDDSVLDSNGNMPFYMYKLDGYLQVVSFRNPTKSLDSAFKFVSNADCENNWSKNVFCQLPLQIKEAEGLMYTPSDKKWYWLPNLLEWNYTDKSKWKDITELVGKTGKLGSPDTLKAILKQKEGDDDKGKDKTDKEEKEGVWTPIKTDSGQTGVIQSYLAYLIPDFFHINLFDSSNPEASKKFNRFLLILAAVGVVAYGRKRRVSRRTARRTSRRVTARKTKRVTA